MGVDIVSGRCYLIKIDGDRLYKRRIGTIMNKFNVNYIDHFDALQITDKVTVQRYNDVKQYKPVNWYAESYCKKINYDENVQRESVNVNEILDYKFEKDNEWDDVEKFNDFVIEHGWYDIQYISY